MNLCNIVSENIENLESIIEELNDTLFKRPWIEDIIEVTYTYNPIWNNLDYNSTIFEKFTWIPFKEDMDFNLLRHEVKCKLKEYFSVIDLALEKLDNLWILHKKGVWIVWSLLEARYSLQIVDTWIDFELEKAWYNHWLSDFEVDKLVLIQLENNKKRFGERMSENEEDIIMVFDYLNKIFSWYWDKEFNYDEKNVFTGYIGLLQEMIPEHKFIPAEKFETPMDNKLLSKRISRDNYVKIFDLIFEILWMKIRCVIDDVDSFYDWWDAYHIPNSKEVEYITLKKFLLLIVHEFTHYITNNKNKERYWNYRSEWSMEKDEWVAETFESLFIWETIDNMNICWIWWPRVLLWELLTARDYREFMILYRRLLSHEWLKKWTLKWILLRANRWFPISYDYIVTTKDASYPRWKRSVKKYIQSKWEMKGLLEWKTGIEYIKNWNIDLTDIWNEVILHILIAEIIYKHLAWEKIFNETFKDSLKLKYWDLCGEFDLTDRFTRRISHNISVILKIAKRDIT